MTSFFSSLEATPSTSSISQSITSSSSFSSDARASATQSSQSNNFPFSHSTSGSTTTTEASSPVPTSSVASTTSTSPAANATSSAAGTENVGLIVGIAVTVAVGALLLLGMILFYCWRRRRGRRQIKGDYERPEPEKPSPIIRTSPLRPLSLGLSLNSPLTTRSSKKSLWGNHSKSDELLCPTPPQISQKSLRGTQSPIVKPSPTLPISEPIRKELKLDEPRTTGLVVTEPLLNRPIASEKAVEASKPFVVLDQGPGVLPEPRASPDRPVSETTTIATSSGIQTPKRPPIAVQRPFSTATSTATSFEEDWEPQMDDDVPPLPAIPNTQLIRKLSAKRSFERPTRLDLVARDEHYHSRQLNSVLETPMYDNGNVILPAKISIRSLGQPPFSILKGSSSQRPHLADLVASDVTSAGILFDEASRATPSPMSPPTPYDIPLRHSSIAKTYMDPRKNGSVRSFLMESSSEDSTSDRAIRMFPKPLSFRKKFGSPMIGSSIQHITYPAVPASASESGRPSKRPSFSFEFPIKLKSVSEASTVDDAEESPLLPSARDKPYTAVDQLKIVDHDNELGSSRTDMYASRPVRPSEFVPLDDFLTPKRTQSSELIDSQFVMVTLQDQQP